MYHSSLLFLRLLAIVLAAIAISSPVVNAQEQQNPLTANGGSVLAMAGEGCVALAVDKRFASGNQVSCVQPRSLLGDRSCYKVSSLVKMYLVYSIFSQFARNILHPTDPSTNNHPIDVQYKTQARLRTQSSTYGSLYWTGRRCTVVITRTVATSIFQVRTGARIYARKSTATTSHFATCHGVPNEPCLIRTKAGAVLCGTTGSGPCRNTRAKKKSSSCSSYKSRREG